MQPSTYAELIRYDGAVVQRDQRDRIVPCAVQPRDVAVVYDVWRYKFLTASQLLELHWPRCVPHVGRRRLTRLFDAGFLERFRPVTRTGGSFPWTYQLGQAGHRLLRETGAIAHRARFETRTIYDYRYVLHEIHLNAWILAWRRLLGAALIDWHGETELFTAGYASGGRMRLEDDRTVHGLRDARSRLIRPDAILEVERRTAVGTRAFLIEYDRTRRLDKNFEKFIRYDAFLCWWWRQTPLARHGEAPFVLFVCQDDDQRDSFLHAADRELTGHLWQSADTAFDHEYVGRDHMLFATEVDVHGGSAVAWRVPAFPPRHAGRAPNPQPRGVRLPSRTRNTVQPAA